MNTVERIKAELKARRIPVSRMEKDLGFANGYISQLRKGTMPAERLIAVAEYLEKPVEYFLYGEKEKDQTTDNDDLAEELQILRDNPATRSALRVMKNMTPEEVRLMSDWITMMRGGNNIAD